MQDLCLIFLLKTELGVQDGELDLGGIAHAQVTDHLFCPQVFSLSVLLQLTVLDARSVLASVINREVLLTMTL